MEGGNDAQYVSTGHLVYAIGGVLFAIPFDSRRLDVTGGPVPVVEGVRRGLTGAAAYYSVSQTGSLAFVPGPTVASAARRDLALIDRKGTVNPFKLPPGSYDHPRVSPDGKHVTFATEEGKDAIVWVYDVGGGTSMRRLTFGGRNRLPIWSAESRRVTFQSDREGDEAIFWQPADGTGTAERLTKPEQGTTHVPDAWSPDGHTLLFSIVKGSTATLWTLSLPDKKAAPFGGVQTSIPPTAIFSPDGRWVAYDSTEVGRSAVFVQPFPATGAKYQISNEASLQTDQ